MMTEAEVEARLKEMAESFMVHFRNKKYVEAKHCYDSAITIATFLDLSIPFRMELFGNRPYVDDDKELEPGLFIEEYVQKAYWKCIQTEKERVLEEEARMLARRR